MKSNLLSFNVIQMKKFAETYRISRDEIDWAKILELNADLPPTLIQVFDDNDGKKVELAYAGWRWDVNDNEMKFGKIEVKDEALQKSGIGTVLMKMVIYIAKFYRAPRITGTIAGAKYLWHWYAKLGYTIHDQNKLLMAFGEL